MAKRKVGRPKFEPTDEQRRTVEAMVGYGIPCHDIRMVVINPGTGNPISEVTLREHFRHEIDTGFVKANAKVGQSLHQQAIGQAEVVKVDKDGNVVETVREAVAPVPSVGIWWSKARMGWKETVKQEITGKDGGAIEVDDARERLVSRIMGIHDRLADQEAGSKPH